MSSAEADIYDVESSDQDRPPPPRPVTPVVRQRQLRAARKGRSGGVEALASLFFPSVYRIAAGLTGRSDLADAAARSVVRLSVRQMPTWRDESEPGRWFRHHTILQVRRLLAETIGTREDVLLPEGATPDAVNFVTAYRKLPHQQREAWLLAELEGLPTRLVSQAMDCSTEAAQNHLNSAHQALQLQGPRRPPTHELAEYYGALTPADEAVTRQVRGNVRRATWPRRVLRVVEFVLTLLLLAAIAYGVWVVYPLIEI